MGSSQCQRQENRPDYAPQIWAGSSETGSIVRSQSNSALSCLDPQFDGYVSMTYDTLGCIYQTYVDNCEKFKEKVVTCRPVDLKLKKIVETYLKDPERFSDIVGP